MTKDECLRAARRLRSMYNLLLPGDAKDALAALEGYVAALDVCTSAEREFLSAYFEWWHVEPPTAEQVTRLEKARKALVAERTPPDPVETFIAEVRAALSQADQASATAALRKLDAARGRE